jgi:hypothetical protein
MKKILANSLTGVLFSMVVLLWTTQTTQAYLDGATGSFLVQILLGSIFGGLLALRIAWDRVTGAVSKLASMGRGTTNSDEDSGE